MHNFVEFECPLLLLIVYDSLCVIFRHAKSDHLKNEIETICYVFMTSLTYVFWSMLMFLLAKSGVGLVLITTLIDSFSTISLSYYQLLLKTTILSNYYQIIFKTI